MIASSLEIAKKIIDESRQILLVESLERDDQEMFDAGTEGTVGTEFVNRIITIAETDIDTDVDYGPYCWNQFVDCE